jgi:hypothetical protein
MAELELLRVRILCEGFGVDFDRYLSIDEVHRTQLSGDALTRFFESKAWGSWLQASNIESAKLTRSIRSCDILVLLIMNEYINLALALSWSIKKHRKEYYQALRTKVAPIRFRKRIRVISPL